MATGVEAVRLMDATSAVAAAAAAIAAEAADKQSHSQEVDPADLRPGDHIYCWKRHWNVPFQHHGIVLECRRVDEPDPLEEAADSGVTLGTMSAAAGATPPVVLSSSSDDASSSGTASGTRGSGVKRCRELDSGVGGVRVYVAHFAGQESTGVEVLPLSVFLNCAGERQTLRRAQYGADLLTTAVHLGAQYARDALPPEQTLELALHAVVDGDRTWEGRYNPLALNCEVFACYCKTGQRPAMSRQVSRAVALGLVAVGGAATAAMYSGTLAVAAGGAITRTQTSQALRRTANALVRTAPAVVGSVVLAQIEQEAIGWGVKRLRTTVFG